MSITPRFLDEIKARVAASDIIGRSVKLTRAGREFKGCCPFHHEKTPSFTVNDDKQFYHCFGCGAHGDVIGFVQQHNNVNFVEAVEMLAGQAGMQMPAFDPKAIENAEKQKDLYDLMDKATIYFQKALKSAGNKDILTYAKSRGLSDHDIDTFRIGFAPHDRQALRKYLKAEGFSDAEMIDAGVIKPSSRGGEPYAFFNERLMFPVADRRGRVIAYGGRALPDHLQQPSRGDFTPPKYINSGDTALFDKGRTLYAFSKARQASGEGKPIIVTEGYMDVIAAHRHGFSGAVAPMGTALTEEQIVLLWKMIADHEKNPILCFDGDNAGRKAASRALERIMPLLQPNHSVRFAFMPEGQDPDDLLRSAGPKGFQAVIDSAMSLIDYLWLVHTASRNLETPEARAGIAKDLRTAISKIADKEIQSHYNALVKEKISKTFFPRFEGRNKSFGNSGGRAGPKLSLKPKKPQFSEMGPRILLAGVLNHPHIYDEVEEIFGEVETRSSGMNALRMAMAGYLSAQDGAIDTGAFHAHLKEQGYEKEMSDILSKAVYVHAAFVSPSYDQADVLQKWQAMLETLKQKAADQEIRMGWRRALDQSDEKGEQALMAQINARKGE